MNSVKGKPYNRSERELEAEKPYHLVDKDFLCIFRPSDLVKLEEKPPGIIKRIKKKFQAALKIK